MGGYRGKEEGLGIAGEVGDKVTIDMWECPGWKRLLERSADRGFG